MPLPSLTRSALAILALLLPASAFANVIYSFEAPSWGFSFEHPQVEERFFILNWPNDSLGLELTSVTEPDGCHIGQILLDFNGINDFRRNEIEAFGMCSSPTRVWAMVVGFDEPINHLGTYLGHGGTLTISQAQPLTSPVPDSLSWQWLPMALGALLLTRSRLPSAPDHRQPPHQ